MRTKSKQMPKRFFVTIPKSVSGGGRLENLMRFETGRLFVSNFGKCDGGQLSEPLCQERLRESVSNLIET